ncbi:hypothetical protein [Falsiroseomonas sp. HW251]|uniref:hypothetical protein n=1 Tax=Falsiroseomonas sp. HW251 TaxID=3390998 RepID=UPI003D3175BA
MSLSVATWRNRYRADEALSEEQIRGWDEAPRRMAVPAAAETDVILCIRRLDLVTRIRDSDGTARLGMKLEEALDAVIAAALRDHATAYKGADVVLWRDRREAIADLLHRAAAGDMSRAWAWRQAAVLPETATRDARDALDAAVALVAEEPGSAWPILARLILAEPQAGSLTALLGALSAQQWEALLPLGADDPAPVAPLPLSAADPVATALLSWIGARPALAVHRRDALARLLARATARGAVPSPARVAAASATVEAIIPTEGVAAVTAAVPHAHTRATTPGAAEDAPPAPDLPPLAGPLATEWGGLLFLLPLLATTGLAEELDEALPAALHAIGLGLGAPPDDHGLRAFCGGTWPEPRDLPEQLAPLAIAALEAALHDRLGPPDDRETWLPDLCRRDALLTIEPGWIEAAFPLSFADARLRRGAIDLDPGHLPWLGCVVRFRYA